jgi:hypothetical protein
MWFESPNRNNTRSCRLSSPIGITLPGDAGSLPTLEQWPLIMYVEWPRRKCSRSCCLRTPCHTSWSSPWGKNEPQTYTLTSPVGMLPPVVLVGYPREKRVECERAYEVFTPILQREEHLKKESYSVNLELNGKRPISIPFSFLLRHLLIEVLSNWKESDVLRSQRYWHFLTSVNRHCN